MPDVGGGLELGGGDVGGGDVGGGDVECGGGDDDGAEKLEVGDGDPECFRETGADVPGCGARPPPEDLRGAFEPGRFGPDPFEWPDDPAALDPAALPDAVMNGATAGRCGGAGPLKAT